MLPVDQLPYLEWEPESGGTERIYADTWESEQISLEASATQVAVENGSLVADHIILTPDKCTLRLFFSGSPIRGDLDPEYVGTITQQRLQYPPKPESAGAPIESPGGLMQAFRGLTGAGQVVPSAVDVLTFPDAPPRHKVAFERLRQLRDSRVLIAVGTTVARLESMAITSLAIARTADDGNSGSIDLTLEQMTFATTDVANALPIPAAPRQQKKQDANAGSGETVQDKKTGLAALADTVSGVWR